MSYYSFIMLFMIIAAPALGIYIGWRLSDSEWHEVFRCKKCGFTSRYNDNFLRPEECKGCGEHSNRIRELRRAAWFSYQYKNPNRCYNQGGEG